MAPGIIPFANIPQWPSPPEGLMPACRKALRDAGFPDDIHMSPTGFHVSDVPTVNGVLSTYVGSGDELSVHKTKKQADLDILVDEEFDLKAFIRDGNSTSVTGANVGNFLAQITNNYRTLRAQIAAASTVAAVEAININQGWPGNP